MAYYPSSNMLYFTSLSNSTYTTTGYTLGTAGEQATGTNCILDVADSSATLNPSSSTASVTLNLVLALQPSALGTQSVVVEVYDNSGMTNNNWYPQIASWTAFSPLTTNAPTASLASAPGTGASQTLHYEISDGNGYTLLWDVGGSLSQGASWWPNSPCFFEFYLPDTIYLYQIANGTYTLLGEGAIGGSWSYPSTNGIIGGSGGLAGPGTCSIDLNQSSVSTGADGTGILQIPNLGSPWQPVTNLYLDLYTGLDSTAQGTLPLVIGLDAFDLVLAKSGGSNVGTWGQGPVLNITSSHPDPFIYAQTNAAYTVTVSNIGSEPTSGTVTVTETLPSALSLASIVGSGWVCSGATCTYSSSVAAGASFPAITVTVAPTAVGSWTNQVSASGGGSSVTATATDPTSVVVPDISITSYNNSTNSTYAGLSITLDAGTQTQSTCTTPCSITDGHSHTVTMTSPEAAPPALGGAEAVFTGWSDGGAQGHTIQPGTSVAVNFNTYYQITGAASPSAGGIIVAGALSQGVIAGQVYAVSGAALPNSVVTLPANLPAPNTCLSGGWCPAGTTL